MIIFKYATYTWKREKR